MNKFFWVLNDDNSQRMIGCGDKSYFVAFEYLTKRATSLDKAKTAKAFFEFDDPTNLWCLLKKSETRPSKDGHLKKGTIIDLYLYGDFTDWDSLTEGASVDKRKCHDYLCGWHFNFSRTQELIIRLEAQYGGKTKSKKACV